MASPSESFPMSRSRPIGTMWALNISILEIRILCGYCTLLYLGYWILVKACIHACIHGYSSIHASRGAGAHDVAEAPAVEAQEVPEVPDVPDAEGASKKRLAKVQVGQRSVREAQLAVDSAQEKVDAVEAKGALATKAEKRSAAAYRTKLPELLARVAGGRDDRPREEDGEGAGGCGGCGCEGAGGCGVRGGKPRDWLCMFI